MQEVNKIRNELDIKQKQENVDIKELQSALSSQQQSLLAANEQVKKLIYFNENQWDSYECHAKRN